MGVFRERSSGFILHSRGSRSCESLGPWPAAPPPGKKAALFSEDSRAHWRYRCPALSAPRYELLLHADHYRRLIREEIPQARRFLWIATADLKDLHVEGGPKRAPFRPFVALLAEMVERGVHVRLLHAKEPGPRFRADFDRFPALLQSDLFERALCPRLHMKVIVVDGCLAYVGSANLTGAGIGAKGEHRRNFEAGFLTDDRTTVTTLMNEIDGLWLGRPCASCQRRDECPEPLDSQG